MITIGPSQLEDTRKFVIFDIATGPTRQSKFPVSSSNIKNLTL